MGGSPQHPRAGLRRDDQGPTPGAESESLGGAPESAFSVNSQVIPTAKPV